MASGLKTQQLGCGRKEEFQKVLDWIRWRSFWQLSAGWEGKEPIHSNTLDSRWTAGKIGKCGTHSIPPDIPSLLPEASPSKHIYFQTVRTPNPKGCKLTSSNYWDSGGSSIVRLWRPSTYTIGCGWPCRPLSWLRTLCWLQSQPLDKRATSPGSLLGCRRCICHDFDCVGNRWKLNELNGIKWTYK